MSAPVEAHSFEKLLSLLPCNVTDLVRALVDRPDEVVALVALDGRTLYGNAAYYRSLGFEPGEEITPFGISRVHPDDMSKVMESVSRSATDGHATAEYRARHRDGQWIWRSGSSVLLRDQAGQPAMLLYTIRDSTQRVAAEEALRQSEERLRLLVESADDVILMADLTGHVVWSSVPSRYGLTSEFLQGRCVTEVFPPEQAAQLWADEAIVRETGESRTCEHRLTVAGHDLWFHDLIYPMRDAEGRMTHIGWICRNITALKEAQAALHESDRNFRRTFDEASIGAAIVSLDSRIVRVNDEFCRFMGYPSEELVGLRIADITHPEDWEVGSGQSDRLIRGEIGSYQIDKRYVRKDARVVWGRVSVHLMKDDAGRPLHFLPMIEDITERKHAEEALRRSEARYRGIVEDQIDWIARYDVDRRITFVNDALCRRHGMRAEDILGQSFLDFVRPGTQQDVERFVASLTPAHPVGVQEVTGVDAEGRSLYQQWVHRAILDADGKIVEYQAVGRDLSALRRAQEQLRQSEARYRGIVEDQTELICRFLRDGTLTFVNEAYCRYFGMKRDELIGRRFMPLISEDDRGRIESVIAALSPENPVASAEERVTNGQGEVRWQQWTNRVISDDEGRIIEYQAVGRDITELKRANELLIEKSRMETASTMAGGIAHDFNNLMVAVLGNAELLRSEVPGKTDALEMLDSVSRSARRAADLAQKLLAFARGGKYRPTTVDLNEVVRETLQMQGRAIPSGVRVDVELADDLAKTSADRTQMSQVVMNLLLNAVEAVGLRGRVVISTWNASASRDGRTRGDEVKAEPHACLSVRDNGPGMDAETVARVFQPFFTTKGPGRGLGLSAVFGIVKNHGGDVGVESVPGRGTTFTVCLPATVEPARRPTRKASASTRGTRTILVIDDEESVVTVTRRMLERLGYRVLTASSGPEAIRVAKEHRGDIHLALLDIGMPGMDGAEAFPLLAAARPSMRIIISSGYDLGQMSRGLVEAGARGFIQKPFVSEELSREIRAVLDSD